MSVQLRLVGAGGEPVDLKRTLMSHGVGERPADVDAEDRHGSELREEREG